ncbi:LysR family transcriptional regulator [Paeniglutamicibacter sulfureus]|uniref:DNA-binding transcriptional LysR family regulator n=1 Tax=Paeniglutamicibacter sulfureus TaxID=43666 RepID=A0ABU2BN90_9MICC|nr:LysR family transcriptional regulator [Paeniglutamicibacter sulfureus]MDR7358804.1 DNA-binding transcriptional LysR family regulator [Paeniglutamicibacter sulfureus]
MDIRHIRYFLEITRQGSISKAAKVLQMTQPPLSASLKNLEDELGVRLLDRTARGITPTRAGRLLLEKGARLVDETEHLTQELMRQGQGLSGSLHLAVILPFAWAYLPRVLGRFREASPGTDISLTDVNPGNVIEQIRNGNLDVAIVATGSASRLQTMYQDDTRVELISKLGISPVLPTRFKDAPKTIPLQDLMGETWLLPMPSLRLPGMTEMLVDFWLAQGLPLPSIKPVTSLQTTLPLVAADLGISIMPPEIQQIARTTIVTRKIDPPIPPMEIAAVWSTAREPSEVATKFIEVLVGPRAART